VGKTICEKTSLLPGSCASPGHLPALGVSRLPHLPADAYWERLTDCLVMKVADEYDTKDIFGFDRQFEDAGYKRLGPTVKQAA
jgi:hypothetical protein